MQLVLRKVSTSYETNDSEKAHQWALHDVSLEIQKGEFFGIAGPTGSGKSTLLQHLNGLLQPNKGHVLIGNKDLADKDSLRKLRGTVGLALQYPERQLFADTVLEDVSFGPKNKGMSIQQAHLKTNEALEAVGLDPERIAGVNPFSLSGGQQRLVALAGVLAMEPEILVLDEPTAGLDPRAHHHLIEIIRGLNAKGLTIVMASHNMDDLAACCTHLAVLNKGRIVISGTSEEVFSCGQKLESIGLELPFAQRFANELKGAGIRLPNAFYPTIEQLACDLTSL